MILPVIAVFKLIKTWLPEKAVEKIKFLKKDSLKEFVDPDQALKCWGGNDNYSFVFVPEAEESAASLNSMNNKKVRLPPCNIYSRIFAAGVVYLNVLISLIDDLPRLGRIYF